MSIHFLLHFFEQKGEDNTGMIFIIVWLVQLQGTEQFPGYPQLLLTTLDVVATLL